MADHTALEGLMWRASLTGEGDRANLLAHPEVVALPLQQIEAGQVFVAEDDAGIAGFGVLLLGAGEAELDGLFVEPARMRNGVGRALMAEAERRTTAAGADALTVAANPHALAFYSACGFEPAGETQTDFGPVPLMGKGL